MAKSHPARFLKGMPIQWVRNAIASFALLASLTSLALILYSQYGVRLMTAVNAGIGALSLAQQAVASQPEAVSWRADPEAGEYRAIGEYLARRYHVSRDLTTDIVARTYAAGHAFNLDPLLILAVISVESSFNPIAESGMGAKGLMQIIPRFHGEKFDSLGGENTVFAPETNIVVGSQILKEYLVRTGNVNDALQMYVGASSPETENGYAEKVLAECDRLHQLLHQYQYHNRQQIARS